MRNIDALALGKRIQEVRIAQAGGRGKSKFARALGLSPSTYSYYESGRMPPVDTLLAISQLSGADLRWLLTGEDANLQRRPGARRHGHFLNQLEELLARHPELAEPVAAFVELLAEKKGAQAVVTAQRGAGQGRANDWIPVLGRTAAGIIHCWDETTMPDSHHVVMELEQLVESYTGRQVVGTDQGRAAIDFESVSLSEVGAVNLVRVAGDDSGAIVEFVQSRELAKALPDAFGLHVDGDSMSPRIEDGDVVIVSPSVAAKSGQVALARIKDQIGVTCKVIRLGEGQVHLVPINERYDSKVVSESELCWALTVICHVRFAGQ